MRTDLLRRSLTRTAFLVAACSAFTVAACSDDRTTAPLYSIRSIANADAGLDAQINTLTLSLYQNAAAARLAVHARWTNIKQTLAENGGDPNAPAEHSAATLLTELIGTIQAHISYITPPSGQTREQAAAQLVQLMSLYVYGPPAPPPPGVPSAVGLNAGNNQTATAGTEVSTKPSVKVTDANGNAVSGVTVTFAVATGGGSITGGTPSTGSDGIATVGSWTLGTTPGENTLNATAPGLAGSPLTFSATGTQAPDPGGSWTTLAPMPVARWASTTGVIAGKLYEAQGGPFGTDPTLQVYDPASNTWALGASMLTNRGGPSGEVIAGKFYVVGGCINSDCRIGVNTILEVYDPATNTWTAKAPMPQARAEFASGVINGQLYVAGGFVECGACTATTTLQVYDPATDTWATRAAMPVAASHSSGAVIGGKLYVVGGLQNGVSIATTQVYDPATNTWTTRAPVPTPRYNHGAEALNGLIYVVGGFAGGAATNSVVAYDLVSDSWTSAGPMPTARGGIKPRAINGLLYVAGGYDGVASFFSKLEAFTP